MKNNCTYVFRTVLCLSLLVAWMVPGFSQQIEKGIQVSNGEYLGFLEYKPTDYATKTGTKYPLIIFLHGIGERGNGTTDLKNVGCCGLPRVIKRGHNMTFTWNGKKETFIVLSPQCPKKYGMWPVIFINELIDYAKKNLRIDPDRIFLTGLSMGGGGTYKYISTNPVHAPNLAAAATICAPCTFSQGKYVADAKLPLWSFHAADDAVALASCTESAIRKVNEANPEVVPLKTIWPTGGHIVWDRVYTDTNYRYNGVVNIYEWFLGQNRKLAPNKLPVARGNGTINISASSGIATLNASASTDPDGRIVRYVWKKTEGPAAGVITNPFGPNSSTTVTGLTTPGTYKYELSVVDDRASYTTDIVTVVVSSGASVENKAPIANAGKDVVINLPTNTVKLDASASSDPDGSIASYSWTKISGPAISILSPNTSAITLNMLTQGTYVFKLKVTDNKGASAEDQVTVTVNAALPNTAPIARAGVNISIQLPQNSVSLDGSGSSDADGTIKTYAWTKVSGPQGGEINSASAAKTTVTSLEEGTYVYKLKVTDNGGATGEDQITVTVAPAPPVNKAPIARAGVNFSITLPQNATKFDGSKSADEDGTIKTYAWTKISGPAGGNLSAPSTAVTNVSNLVEGVYVFRLKVTDNSGATGEDKITLTVLPEPVVPNVSPVANAGTDITITLPVNKTVLNGTGSQDGDGTIKIYEWTKLSGPSSFTIVNAEQSSTEVTGLVQGTYEFKLKITDDRGAAAEDIVVVKVNPAPNKKPVANAGNDVEITLPENSVSLNGGNSSDPDGSIATYAWSKIAGPENFIITDPAVAITTANGLSEGTYKFRLQVTDNKGAKSADTVVVIVLPQPHAPNVAPVAQAGANVSITLPVNSTTLNGSASSDEDGTITAYSWSYVTGPESFIIAEPNSVSTGISELVEGTYKFRLEVMDDDGATSADTIQVVVKKEDLPPPPPNKLPKAIAGDDITITFPQNTVTLDGSKSIDDDGTLTNYSWLRLSGPAPVTIAKPSYHITEVRNLVEGEYFFRLQVKDNDGALGFDTIKVTVLPAPNKIPFSEAGAAIEIQLPLNEVELNGSDSYDSDGSLVGYKWEFVTGPAGSAITNAGGVTTKVTGLSEGKYRFRLTVTDNEGAKASDVVDINVLPEPPNAGPIAKAGEDIEVNLPVNHIELDGSASYDPDGIIVSYSWVKVSGPGGLTIANSTTATPRVVGAIEGEYLFRLTVKDDKGVAGSDVVKVIVYGQPEPVNQLPIAYAGKDQEISYPTSSTTLDGELSSDPDGSIVSYQWTQLSGPANASFVTPTEPKTTVNDLQTGEYIFVLTVRDDLGSESADTMHVSVINTMRYQEVMNVYPNPAISSLNVQLTSDTMGTTRITIFNMSGSVVKSINKEKTQTQLFENVIISDLQTGVYYLEVMIAGKLRKVSKFIKAR